MATDWRERYLELADEHERQSTVHADAERDLIRLIVRLCVACSGLDPALDPHLNRLRNAAKAGRPAGLLREAGVLADALVHAPEQRARPGVVQRLLAHRGLGSRQIDDALKLWASVATDPARASAGQLDELAKVLLGAPQTADGEEARPGLLARLVGKGTTGAAERPNQLLLKVLEVVQWPEGVLATVDAFRAELAGDEAAWVHVVRKISDLAVSAMDQAQFHARSAETFLTELNHRLEELDRYMLGEVQRREDSRLSGQSLGNRMDSEVVTLTNNVHNSEDLAGLQAGVIDSLDRMQAHVRVHLEEESARLESAEADAAQLRKQMRRLEHDTFDLRRQVAQSYREAMRDPLTGLPNRRAYDERVAQEYARWKRFGDPLALLVLDIDNFKSINDTFGHSSGDKALAMIGKILGERVRETDFIARYGGEEFVALLTGAQREDVSRVAEAMRAGVQDGGLHAKGRPVKVTVSIGAAVFGVGDSLDAAFDRADKALYAAKRQGKNRVVFG